MSTSPIRGGQTARRERGLPAPARHAFSLLELTLVLAIIAALMGVAAFALLGQSTQARVRTTKASLSILKTATESYFTNESVYPDTLARLVSAGYVEPKSMEDSFRRPFVYRTPGLGNRPYTLMSGGPDGDPGTPGDNIDVWTMDATGTR